MALGGLGGRYGGWQELEEALRLGFGYPAVVALNAGKQRLAVMRSSFDEKAITKFVRGLVEGKVSSEQYPSSGLPPPVAVPPWNGRDGQQPADDVEEDRDL